MANKIVTFTDPTAADIQAITIIYSGGLPTSVEVLATIQSSDADAGHGGSKSTDPATYSAAAQTALTNLAVEAAPKLSAGMNFPP